MVAASSGDGTSTIWRSLEPLRNRTLGHIALPHRVAIFSSVRMLEPNIDLAPRTTAEGHHGSSRSSFRKSSDRPCRPIRPKPETVPPGQPLSTGVQACPPSLQGASENPANLRGSGRRALRRHRGMYARCSAFQTADGIRLRRGEGGHLLVCLDIRSGVPQVLRPSERRARLQVSRPPVVGTFRRVGLPVLGAPERLLDAHVVPLARRARAER
jgi:hypothetical protein